MKITDIRTRNICIPLSTLGKHEPVTMWYGSRFAAIKTIIFIDTDEGITGLGETSIGAGGDQRLFEQIKSRLIGRDPHDINSIERSMNLTGQVTTKLGHLLDTSASSNLNITGSIDQALWDIVGKAANQPIYNLIGGKYRDRVEARYWMGAKPPDKCADEVKRASRCGFQVIQNQDRAEPGSSMSSAPPPLVKRPDHASSLATTATVLTPNSKLYECSEKWSRTTRRTSKNPSIPPA